MKPVSFKDIKLFRTKDTPTNKSKRNSSKPSEEKEIIDKKKLIQSPFLYLFIFVIVLAYFLAHVPSRTIPVLEIGEIATSDIIAPAEITIIDTETTENRRKQAAEAVPPVYSFNTNVFLNTQEKIRELFSF
jgi:membrane-associated HD superfamily phosphohydrolase